jgi:hypothetical protein
LRACVCVRVRTRASAHVRFVSVRMYLCVLACVCGTACLLVLDCMAVHACLRARSCPFVWTPGVLTQQGRRARACVCVQLRAYAVACVRTHACVLARVRRRARVLVRACVRACVRLQAQSAKREFMNPCLPACVCENDRASALMRVRAPPRATSGVRARVRWAGKRGPRQHISSARAASAALSMQARAARVAPRGPGTQQPAGLPPQSPPVHVCVRSRARACVCVCVCVCVFVC